MANAGNRDNIHTFSVKSTSRAFSIVCFIIYNRMDGTKVTVPPFSRRVTGDALCTGLLPISRVRSGLLNSCRPWPWPQSHFFFCEHRDEAQVTALWQLGRSPVPPIHSAKPAQPGAWIPSPMRERQRSQHARRSASASDESRHLRRKKAECCRCSHRNVRRGRVGGCASRLSCGKIFK